MMALLKMSVRNTLFYGLVEGYLLYPLKPQIELYVS